ncbi:MAG: hypothetical protein QW407_06835 [Thermofilaceae archaeon]
MGKPSDPGSELPQAVEWYGFPLATFEGILRVAWGRRWGLEEYCGITVRGEKMLVGAFGQRFFALLPGCEKEFKVTQRLSSLADALRAFRIAGLKPGSIAFAPIRDGRLTAVQLRGGWLRAYIAPVVE